MKLKIIFIFSFFWLVNFNSQSIHINNDAQYNINIVPNKDIILSAFNDFYNNKEKIDETYSLFNKQSQEKWGKGELLSTIYKLGKTEKSNDYFKPTILGIIDVVPEKKYLIKLALISNDDNVNNSIQVIYNIIADYDKQNNKVTFSRFTDWFIKDWYKIEVDDILYFKNKKEDFSLVEAKKLSDFNIQMSKLFKVPVKKMVYFSCKDAFELYNLRGFDYAPNMFFGRNGGLVYYGGKGNFEHLIYSANDNEYYPHELSHFYIDDYSTHNTSRIASEGIATYLGGSSKNEMTYDYHLKILKNHLANKNSKITDYFAVETMKMIDSDVSTLYSTGSLLAKLIFEKKGLEGWKLFLDIPEKDLIKGVSKILNIKSENLNSYLITELEKI